MLNKENIINSYKNSEANLEEIIELKTILEKAKPIKPYLSPKNDSTWHCPRCGVMYNLNKKKAYCSYCGQKIDWSEKND